MSTDKVYRWETGYEKTWSAITNHINEKQESSTKPLEQFLDQYQTACKRRRLTLCEKTTDSNKKLGMLRYIYLILDVSKAALKQDYKPTRITAILYEMANFINNFYENNPLGNLGIITTKDKKAMINCPLSSSANGNNPKNVLREIQNLIQLDADNFCTGEPSIQTSLLKAASYLSNLSTHFSREVLLVMSSLNTMDNGDIDSTIRLLQKNNIKVNIIHLSCEIEFCKNLAKNTGGKLVIPKDSMGFEEALLKFTYPDELKSLNVTHPEIQPTSVIKMGFPSAQKNSGLNGKMTTILRPTINSTQLESVSKISKSSYQCPRCKLYINILPIKCPTCGLQLITSTYLAKNYHHLFSIPEFRELKDENDANQPKKGLCHSCGEENDEISCDPDSGGLNYCLDCEIFMREHLHFSF